MSSPPAPSPRHLDLDLAAAEGDGAEGGTEESAAPIGAKCLMTPSKQ